MSEPNFVILSIQTIFAFGCRNHDTLLTHLCTVSQIGPDVQRKDEILIECCVEGN